MDAYTKTVLTVIAVALSIISMKGLMPSTAHAGVFEAGPTFGDLVAANKIKDLGDRQEAARRIIYSIPLVRVHGDVDISD